MSKTKLEKISSDLNKEYDRITNQYHSGKEKIKKDVSDIDSKINDLTLQRRELKNHEFQSGIGYMVVQNDAVESSARDVLYSLNGNIVDIHFNNRVGETFSNISQLDLREVKGHLDLQRVESEEIKIDRSAMSDSLNQIAGAVDFYREFGGFFDIYCSELKKRKKETKSFSKNLLLTTFPNEAIKKGGKGRISESCASMGKLKYDLIWAKERINEEGDFTMSNLPRIIRESCDASISDFKKEDGLYIKENKDKYVMLIDNHDKFISNNLLKRIGVNPKSYPEMIYSEVDKEKFASLSDLLESSHLRKNQKFDLRSSIESAVRNNCKQLGLMSLAGFGAGTLGTIIYQWANSWISQTPVQHGEYSFIAGGILAGLGILGYSTGKGIEATRDKVNDIKRTNKKNNLLVDAIKDTRYVSDPLEITKNLASTYR